MKKRILHLFRCEKFTEGFIDLMNSESEFEHVFWVYGENYPLIQNKLSYFKETNVKYYPRIDIKLNKCSTFKQIQRFDLIIYHGVFDEIIINYFFKYKFLLKKSNKFHDTNPEESKSGRNASQHNKGNFCMIDL